MAVRKINTKVPVRRTIPKADDRSSVKYVDQLAKNTQLYYNNLEPTFNTTEGKRFLDPPLVDPSTKVETFQNKAYFKGGNYDLANRCYFSYSKPDGSTETIWLTVPPNGITWKYKLRTSVIDTYGGQVVQILGVEIEDFQLKGFVPNGFWGRNRVKQNDNSFLWEENYLNAGTGKQYYTGDSDHRMNGLVHLGNFFRQFFTSKTQGGEFSTKNMIFSYPHYNWEIAIIPYAFPRIRIANDEILPEWELSCSVVEYLSSHFISEVTATGKSQINYLAAGIGFAEFIEWSDPAATTSIESTAAARSLGESYRSFITEFNPSDIDTLKNGGFTHPTEVIDAQKTKKINKIIQDRFTGNVS
jgi:hypothetical protein